MRRHKQRRNWAEFEIDDTFHHNGDKATDHYDCNDFHDYDDDADKNDN